MSIQSVNNLVSNSIFYRILYEKETNKQAGKHNNVEVIIKSIKKNWKWKETKKKIKMKIKGNQYVLQAIAL